MVQVQQQCNESYTEGIVFKPQSITELEFFISTYQVANKKDMEEIGIWLGYTTKLGKFSFKVISLMHPSE